MPMRASKRAIGSNVGRMIFRTDSTQRIERRLNKANQSELRRALDRKGLGALKNDDIAKVLAGEHRSGLSPYKMRQVVEALQEVGVARKARTASQMVTQASRDAQSEHKEDMKKLARERRAEANAEEDASAGERGMGVLDRMRGAMGRANKVGTAGVATEQNESAGRAGKKAYDRDRLKLRPRFKLPEDNGSDENPYSGFQA